MTALFPLSETESKTAAGLFCETLRLWTKSSASLAEWVVDNREALARLAESDREAVRAAYRAKRDELTGARQ